MSGKELELELFPEVKYKAILSEKLTDVKTVAVFLKNISRENIPSWILFPKQVHGDKVLLLKDEEPFSCSFEADAIIAPSTRVIGVKTADCVPILLKTTDGAWVGAIHAGWRGTAKKIVYKAIRKLHNLGYPGEKIFVSIGPHIRVCCYEVREDVVEVFRNSFGENLNNFVVKRGRKVYLDLTGLNIFLLTSAGLPEENIEVIPGCTYCTSDLPSFRRDKSTAKVIAGIIGGAEPVLKHLRRGLKCYG